MTDLFDPKTALAAARATLAGSSQRSEKVARPKAPVLSNTYDYFSRSSQSSRGTWSVSPDSRPADTKEEEEEDIIIIQGLSSPEGVGGDRFNPEGPREVVTTPARLANLLEFDLSVSEDKRSQVFAAARVLADQAYARDHANRLKEPTPAAVPVQVAAPAPTYVPAPGDLARAPREWVDGLAQLRPNLNPCPGFRYDEWPRIHAAILTFLEQHSEAAHRLGWNTLELFGVHAEVGATRVDCCGALMVSGGAPALTVTADAIAFARTTFRRSPTPVLSVPVWSFAA